VGSQPRRLGEFDAESVSLPLIPAGHLGTGVAELPLDVALIGLCGGGEAGAQGVSREFPPPLGFRKITPHPGGQRRALDQPGDVPVGKPIGPSLLAPAIRRNSGPWAMRPSLSQVSRATTGQVTRWSRGRSRLRATRSCRARE
jgi:hypothetical protein